MEKLNHSFDQTKIADSERLKGASNRHTIDVCSPKQKLKKREEDCTSKLSDMSTQSIHNIIFSLQES